MSSQLVENSLRTDTSGDSRIVCQAEKVQFAYGEHVALRGVDLQTHPGEIVALLGKNGSGKTTLFRLLSTLLPVQEGRISIAGHDVGNNPLAVRGAIGIVFQAPSLDKKLTVDENIACQAALYGIRGNELTRRRDEVLQQMELTDRRKDLCEKLSGGLKRRVEIAKGMLHHPSLMLLDEPSTGLDPAARLNLHQSLRKMSDDGVSVLLTTHLLDEAEKADRVVIMADGLVVGEGSPHQLRSEMGRGVVTVVATDVDFAENRLTNEMNLEVTRVDHQLRVHCDKPAELVPMIDQRLGDTVQSISIGRPSLEDVFIEMTGQTFEES